MNTLISKAALALLLICSSMSGHLVGDEIVISGNEHAVAVGDFDFSPCNTGSAQGALAVLNQGPNSEMTAGDLWQFFSDRGIDSVENLTICMDWSPSQQQQLSDEVDLSSLQLKIEDPSQIGNLLTDASLGENSLVVPGFEISSFKPEAKLDVALGYDFMKRFGPQSTEKIHLASNGSILPSISFEGTGPSPGRIPNWLGIVGFVLFWLVVFKCLAMATAPKELSVSDSPVTKPGEMVSA